MPLQQGKSREVVSGNIAELVKAGHDPKQAAAIAYKEAGLSKDEMQGMSQRQVDENGYITIEKNPISRVGVFPYLGKNISPECEPDKIYNVLRPAEELGSPEAMASFAMVPLINDHVMLGKGFTPPEDKGVQGTTGEKLTFEDGILYAPLKIFSEALKSLIASGKKALSLGYRVGEWEKKAGVFNGMAYEFIQRGIRGNHIALVDEGRMGPDIAVLDHGFACDSFDLEIDMVEDAMDAEQTKGDRARKRFNAAQLNLTSDPASKKEFEAAKAELMEAKNVKDTTSDSTADAEDAEQKYAVTYMSSKGKRERIGGLSRADADEKASKLKNGSDTPNDVRVVQDAATFKIGTKITWNGKKGVVTHTDLPDRDVNIELTTGERKAVPRKDLTKDTLDTNIEVVSQTKDNGGHMTEDGPIPGPDKGKIHPDLQKAYEKLNKYGVTPQNINKFHPDELERIRKAKDSTTKNGVKDMADKEIEEKKTTLDDVHSFLKDNKPQWDAVMEMMKPASDEAKEGETEIKDAAETEKGKEEEKEHGVDAAEEEKKEEAKDAAMDALEKTVAEMQKNIFKVVAQRDRLAREAASVVGTFDHAEMTEKEVLKYALDKAGIKCPVGQEAGAWAGFMAGRSTKKAGLAFDAKVSTDGLAVKTFADSK